MTSHSLHDEFLRHVHECEFCYPRANRYCPPGRALYDAYTIATVLEHHQTGEGIARWLDITPGAERLRERLREAYRARQQSDAASTATARPRTATTRSEKPVAPVT